MALVNDDAEALRLAMNLMLEADMNLLGVHAHGASSRVSHAMHCNRRAARLLADVLDRNGVPR